MARTIRRAEYFYAIVRDEPGEAYNVLSQLAQLHINLLAFTAVPQGTLQTQLTIFPEDPPLLRREAENAGLTLDGPHPAFLVQGDDALGALAGIHKKLYEVNINVYASSGVTEGKGSFGYVLYVRPDEFERAGLALGI